MEDKTIAANTPVGRRLDAISEDSPSLYLVFNKTRIRLVALITIGRESGNDVVIDSKLASRHHALIQKIGDEYFLKDMGSTNGTFLNGVCIPRDKYVKLGHGDKIAVGGATLVIS